VISQPKAGGKAESKGFLECGDSLVLSDLTLHLGLRRSGSLWQLLGKGSGAQRASLGMTGQRPVETQCSLRSTRIQPSCCLGLTLDPKSLLLLLRERGKESILGAVSTRKPVTGTTYSKVSPVPLPQTVLRWFGRVKGRWWWPAEEPPPAGCPSSHTVPCKDRKKRAKNVMSQLPFTDLHIIISFS
jgi:hypothetical protein